MAETLGDKITLPICFSVEIHNIKKLYKTLDLYEVWLSSMLLFVSIWNKEHLILKMDRIKSIIVSFHMTSVNKTP